jgi:hypothetical protein
MIIEASGWARPCIQLGSSGMVIRGVRDIRATTLSLLVCEGIDFFSFSVYKMTSSL